jgi:hypothetical protein
MEMVHVVYYNENEDYVTEDIISVNPEKNLVEQVNIARLDMSKKLEKVLNSKVYTDKKIIFVSIYSGGINIPWQNKVALRINNEDDILQVAFDFSEEIRKEEKLLMVYTEIYLSI